MQLPLVKRWKMNALFALVMTVYMTTGEVQEHVIGVYHSYEECRKVAEEQRITGECYPVDKLPPEL